MSKFSPPKLKRKQSEYLPEEIIVLDKLNKRPTYVYDPLNTFSGGKHSLYLGSYDIDFREVVSNIYEKGLIRENYPREILKLVTVPELKSVLKAIGKPTSGTKKELIKRVKLYATDEDIKDNIEKNCYIPTTLGFELLEKYSNVVWIYNNKETIFGYNKRTKFNERFFMKHWNVEPAETIINYYESKDSGIVANIYYLQKDYEKALQYGIRKIADDINKQINKCKETGFFYMDAVYYFPIHISDLYTDLNIDVESIEDIINYTYNYCIEDKDLLPYNIYKDIVFPIITNIDDKSYIAKVSKLSNEIRDKFGHDQIDDDGTAYYINEYEEEKHESILEMLELIYNDEKIIEDLVIELINDLDIKLIKKTKEIIDKRLQN